ncbi:hypothetical protein VXQ18_03885 [Brucella abortus]|nr:hypothetical protein [Brucella abortus]
MASSSFETRRLGWYADPMPARRISSFIWGWGRALRQECEKLKNAGVTLNSAYLIRARAGRSGLLPRSGIASLIDPNYWSDPHSDRKMSLEGLKIAREIMQQGCIEALCHGSRRLPGPRVVTDDDLFDYACQCR